MPETDAMSLLFRIKAPKPYTQQQQYIILWGICVSQVWTLQTIKKYTPWPIQAHHGNFSSSLWLSGDPSKSLQEKL